jgi:putative transcriptional regulator
MSQTGRPRGRPARRGMDQALFAELRDSVQEKGQILRGTRPASRTRRHAARIPEDRRGTPDVAALRARFQLSQAKFAALLGISAATVRNWEQGRRAPEGPARVLLRVAALHPEAVLSAVAGRGVR